MRVLPKTGEDWIRLLLLPFKAYPIIATLCLMISVSLPHPRHSGATEAEAFVVLGYFPCALILLITALFFSLSGLRKPALSCLGFGVLSFFIGWFWLPALAS